MWVFILPGLPSRTPGFFGKVDHDRRMSWLVALVADAGVHEDGPPEDLRPVGIVDVPEDMHSWTQRVDTEQKVFATKRHIHVCGLTTFALRWGEHPVENAKRWRVRDQHVRVVRDELPFLLVDPRQELSDIDSLKGVMRLIHLLERNKQRVLVGFSSTDVVLWKAAGATDCATGKFFNLRRFTKSRFAPPSGGGGQLGYFCEEALLALLRASDVVRVQAAGAFSAATLQNPFTQTILDHIQKGTPWLKFGWRHYLWWFADFERRATPASISQMIKSADDKWKAFDKMPLYMEERANDGSWVRQWLRSDSEFKAWVRTLS